MPLVPPDLLPVFNALPGATLLLSPDWMIVGASDDYLAATLTQRATIVGQHIFDAFPDNPETPEANGVANVRASLQLVLATKAPHTMAPQHYDVPDPERPGHFVERHWQPRHTPVLDAAGQVQFIIQSVQDITARRLAERQLRESQAREQAARTEVERQRSELQRLFEQAPVAMALFQGPDYIIELANEPMAAIWGRTLAQTLGQPVFTALPYVRNQGFETLFADVLARGTEYHMPEVPVTIDRLPTGPPTLGYFNLTYRPQRDSQGQITGIFTIAQEVTEQVLARQQVEQLNQELEARVQERTQAALALQTDLLAAARQQADQQAQLYQVFEQTPAQIALLRAPGHRFEYVNPAFQALFSEALLGREVAEAAPELVAQGFGSLLDGVYQTGETYFGDEIPFTPVLAPGEEPRTRYFNFTYQAYREDGAIAGVTIFAFDVTGQVQARQQREAERQQLHKLFMEAPAPVAILDGPELVYQLVNPAYQRIFPGRALLGNPLAAALPELLDSPVPGLLRQVYDTGETCVAQEMRLHMARHDGGPLEDLYCTFTYQARRNAAGAVDGILVFVYDITDQVRARLSVEQNEQTARTLSVELATANAQLTRTNVDLDNFIYTASHDLKVPIANIEGLLHALDRELPPAALVGDVPEMLRLMQLATERFRRTIEQLTDMSKLQHAHSQPATQVLLAAVVEEVRLDLLPLVQQTQARLTVDVPATAYLPFSAKNLRSVVYNLLSNALKYHHPDRPLQVQLTYHRQDHYHVLRVQDNGLGFDVAATTGKLFGMFQRLHTHVEGSGIGLYMVRKMVENSGGRIDVASQVGEGSTFTVFFPVHPVS